MRLEHVRLDNPKMTEENPVRRDLSTLLLKAGSTDWFSECMLMISESQSDIQRVGVANTRVRHRVMHELRDKLKELQKEMEAAQESSGLWDVLAKVAAVVMIVVCAVVSIYCPAALVGVAAGGALLTGGCKAASVAYGSKGQIAEARRAQTQERRSDEVQTLKQDLERIEQAVLAEARMVQRLFRTADSEQATHRQALCLGG